MHGLYLAEFHGQKCNPNNYGSNTIDELDLEFKSLKKLCCGWIKFENLGHWRNYVADD